MEIGKTIQIGKVCVRHIKTDRTNSPIYSDGTPESHLYDKFASHPNCKIELECESFQSWPDEYHLSPVRKNLLKWFPFHRDRSALEVGAGCGALTGLLCSKLRKVTALEYSARRAAIIAHRHASESNLDVVVGALEDLECEEPFDYVTVIGVLEYAGRFHSGEKPYQSFLAKLREFLKPDGTLILAIENKIGLKYITGAPEDHTGRLFESIYDYPSTNSVRTFSKKELAELLAGTGFLYLDWYYPLPDYKLPQVVLSDETLESNDLNPVWILFPSRAYGRSRKQIISEVLLGKTIAKAGLFGDFANSFLVVARTEKSCDKLRCLQFRSTDTEKSVEFRIDTMLFQSGGRKFVVKSPATKPAEPFMKTISERETMLSRFLDGHFKVLRGRLEGSFIEYEYISHPSLKDKLAVSLEMGEFNRANDLFKQYCKKVRSLETTEVVPFEFLKMVGFGESRNNKAQCLCQGPLDLVPENILVDGESWIVVDNIWSFDFPVPIVFLLFRAVVRTAVSLQDIIRKSACDDNALLGLLKIDSELNYVPLEWVKYIKNGTPGFGELLEWDIGFQRYVGATKRASYKILEHPSAETKIPRKVAPNRTDGASLERLLKPLAKQLLPGTVLDWMKDVIYRRSR